MGRVFREVVCATCGVTFQGQTSAKYCEKCAAKRQKAQEKEYRRNGARRPHGSVDYCVICRKPYIVKNGTQLYCDNCRKSAYKAVSRKACKNYWKKNKEAQNEKRRKSPYEIKCFRCGKSFSNKKADRKYCDECRPILRKERERKASLRYYYKNKQKKEEVTDK